MFGQAHDQWLDSADQIGLTIENRLSAFTSPGALFVQQAFIKKEVHRGRDHGHAGTRAGRRARRVAGLTVLGLFARRRSD
jgi:hypothetical protein